jgi:hypothetical protein
MSRMAQRARRKSASPERRMWGERFARKVFLGCGVVGLGLALSCALAGSRVADVSSPAFLQAVLAVPLLWVGVRGTYVTTRNLRRIRREIRTGAAGTELTR